MNADFPAALRTLLVTAVWVSGCTRVEPVTPPNAAAPPSSAPVVTATAVRAAASAGVAAANPLAVDAGLEILAAGGSAADAAVAIQTMLGLVEPQSSGVGGGGFMLYYDAVTNKVTAFDGRTVTLGGFRGQPVVVNFFESW